jgi:hypothetical protein
LRVPLIMVPDTFVRGMIVISYRLRPVPINSEQYSFIVHGIL